MKNQKIVLTAAAVVVFYGVATGDANAFVVQNIVASDFSSDWGGRWRCMQPSCSGQELMLGKTPGTSGQFSGWDVSPRTPGTYGFALTWNTTSNEASITWGTTTRTADLDTWFVSKTGDDLQIFINNNTNNGTSVSLSNVKLSLDGGAFSTVGSGAFAPGTGTQANYGILNLGSFTTLALMGSFTFNGGSSQERPAFTISSGNYTGAVVPVPAALPILAAALAGFGFAGFRQQKSTA